MGFSAAVSRDTRSYGCWGSHEAATLYMQMLVKRTGLSGKSTLTAHRILAEDAMHLESAFQSTQKASPKRCLLTWSGESTQPAACPQCFTHKELENENVNDTQDGLYYKYFRESLLMILNNYTFRKLGSDVEFLLSPVRAIKIIIYPVTFETKWPSACVRISPMPFYLQQVSQRLKSAGFVNSQTVC